MSTLLDFLKNMKLSAAQIGYATIASLIGFLVVALELKGSELHKAQVQLLANKISATDATDDQAIQAARDKFNAVYQDYLNSKRES